MNKSQKTIIGRVAKADFPSDGVFDVPVKIDTGADMSAIWATDIYVDDNHHLHYTLFAPGSDFYTGKEQVRKVFAPRVIRTASGHAQIRYSIDLSIVLGGRKVKGTFTLADRSKNSYPVLVGCKLLNRKFLVDVSRGKPLRKKASREHFKEEFQADPQKFYEKYHQDNERGDIEL